MASMIEHSKYISQNTGNNTRVSLAENDIPASLYREKSLKKVMFN